MDKNFKKSSADYYSDTSVTVKQDQGHQIWYELVEPKQVLSMESKENLALTVSAKKAILKFSSLGNMSIICFEYERK